jgi:hypothetical protein
MDMQDDIKVLVNEEFATFEDEECVVLFDVGIEGVDESAVMVYGPFVDEEEAQTFVACGPHGLEDRNSKIQALYPPHALRFELSDISTIIPSLLDVSK